VDIQKFPTIRNSPKISNHTNVTRDVKYQQKKNTHTSIRHPVLGVLHIISECHREN